MKLRNNIKFCSNCQKRQHINLNYSNKFWKFKKKSLPAANFLVSVFSVERYSFSTCLCLYVYLVPVQFRAVSIQFHIEVLNTLQIYFSIQIQTSSSVCKPIEFTVNQSVVMSFLFQFNVGSRFPLRQFQTDIKEWICFAQRIMRVVVQVLSISRSAYFSFSGCTIC